MVTYPLLTLIHIGVTIFAAGVSAGLLYARYKRRERKPRPPRDQEIHDAMREWM